MPIAICAKCERPAPDSFHDFEKVCECIDWKAKAKKEGWTTIKYPKKYKYRGPKDAYAV